MFSPIAIIGIGCRFPKARGPQAYWELLRRGVDAVTPAPPERGFFNNGADAAPMPWRGGFIDSLAHFDPAFFRIRDEDAAYLDPQQRLALEVCWEALEDAGLPVDSLAGSLTGVFFGAGMGDYSRAQLQSAAHIAKQTSIGCLPSLVANRISYTFDLRGPSITLDAGCAASLAATYQACQGLWMGDCDLALAGGVNLLLDAHPFLCMDRAGLLSPTSVCRPFDARADGTVRGEGLGVVVLKPLQKAIDDNDRIYAVIHGAAMTQDGLTNGIAAPNRWGQEKVIREACRRAKVPPSHFHLVEAHGSASPIGDVIEASAISGAIGSRSAERPCWIGSVKSHFGSLEAAAGVAALAKVALALHHGFVPAQLHYEYPNPHIDFGKLRLRVPTRAEPWPAGGHPPLAGVSATGVGGSNVHVVLGKAPLPKLRTVSAASRLLTLSAKTPAALAELSLSFSRFIATAHNFGVSWHDICYTASVRKSHWDYRLAVIGENGNEVGKALEAFGLGAPSEPIRTGCRFEPMPAPAAEEPYLAQIASLYVAGKPVNWQGLYPDGGQCVSLPTYCWQRKRYWLDGLPGGGGA